MLNPALDALVHYFQYLLHFIRIFCDFYRQDLAVLIYDFAGDSLALFEHKILKSRKHNIDIVIHTLEIFAFFKDFYDLAVRQKAELGALESLVVKIGAHARVQ